MQGDHAQGARRGAGRGADSRLSRRARFAAGALAGRARSVSTTPSRPSRRSPTSSPPPRSTTISASSRSAAARRRQPGKPDLLLQQGVGVRRRGVRLLLQPRLRLLARARRPGGDLLAARGGAPQHRRRRRPLRARRGAAGGGLGDRERRASASWRASCRRSTRSGRSEPAGGDAVPKGLERASPSSRRCTARGSTPPSSTARSASSSSWPPFHLERGRRLFDHEQNRDALVELRKAIYLSPYEPSRTC